MKSIHQQYRQPVKTLAALILTVLAVAALAVCIGQYSAAKLTRANLEDQYDTIGLVSGEYLRSETSFGMQYNGTLQEDVQNWVTDTVHNRPDLIKMESHSELTTAYIPGLREDNFSNYEEGDSLGYAQENIGNPYRCAMLEVTLTQIGTKTVRDVSTYEFDGKEQEVTRSVSILCTGTVDGVTGMAEGIASPVGKNITITVRVKDDQALEDLHLQVGKKYLVYGMDYSDTHGTTLSSKISSNQEGYEELFGAANWKNDQWDYTPIMDQIDCYLTVVDHSSFPAVYMGEGKMVVDDTVRVALNRDENALREKNVPAEEYIQNYQTPTITQLAGTAEDFFASEDGALWHQALEELEISVHGFPVLAVDKLGYQVSFARGTTRIVDGRGFTEQERVSGGKVCVISETLAALNDLAVGDIIEMRTYAYDPNIDAQAHIQVNSTTFPSASIYSRAKGFSSETERFTIVGLYRQSDAWQNQVDAYGFTPNTIFVPKGSVGGEMITGNSGVYYTLALQNGKMEEFSALQAEAGYPNLFVCMDQGYTEIRDSLDAYEVVSTQAFSIGIAVYCVIMMLFVALFPMRQSGVLWTMQSLGAPRKDRVGHLYVSAMSILVPGGILGGIAGAMLWIPVTEKLMEAVSVQIPIQANMPIVATVIVAVHIVLMSIVLWLTAIPMTSDRRSMKRK